MLGVLSRTYLTFQKKFCNHTGNKHADIIFSLNAVQVALDESKSAECIQCVVCANIRDFCAFI